MKKALVVGGASGIGAGIANALPQLGYDVKIADIHPRIAGQLSVDATSLSSIQQLLEKVSSEWASIDLLLITIGAIDEGEITNTGANKWMWLLNANLLGITNLVDTFLPLVSASEEKRIVLTSSGSGIGPYEPGSKLGLYTISKHALWGYFKVLHAELKGSIHVSLLIPSAVKGDLAANSATMRANALGETVDETKGGQPTGRQLADADETGKMFASDIIAGKVIITNDTALIEHKLAAEKEWVMQLIQ